LAGLDIDSELAVFVQYYSKFMDVYTVAVYVCNTYDYFTYVSLSQPLSFSSTPIIDSWSITGNARDIYVNVNNLPGFGDTFEPYEYSYNSALYVDESTRPIVAPVISYYGVFWEYVQMGCTAYSQEVALQNNMITVRDIGGSNFSIDNVVASPTINPTSTLSGRQVNIAYSDSYFVDGIVYDAGADGNNIISVAAGQTTVTSVKHTVHPISILQPVLSETWPIDAGEYYVIDSSGLRLLASEWYGYGGSVTVNIDPNDPAAIQITVVGPYTEVTLAGGPYELAASTGSSKFASLKIAGTGVYAGDNVLPLLTGIDPLKYTRANVNSITNPFIASLEQAYDRGVWSSQKASGPVVTLNASVPVSSITGVGETPGSLIQYRDSTYRIASCSLNGISASLGAENYVTVADVDAIWSDALTSEPFTVNIANPSTFSYSGSTVGNGELVSLYTTGALPDITGTVAVSSAVTTFAGGLALTYYATGHKVKVGDVVTFSGFSVAAYNGVKTITGVSEDSFSVTTGLLYIPGGSGSAAVTGVMRDNAYVVNAAVGSFQLTLQPDGLPIGTTGTQSGTHTFSVGGVSRYDNFWGNYECQDQTIFPYKVA
jgi:hypothetical protein